MQGRRGKLHAACVFSDLEEGRLWTGAVLFAMHMSRSAGSTRVMLSVVTQVEERRRTRTVDGGGSCIIKAGGPGKEAGSTNLQSGKEGGYSRLQRDTEKRIGGKVGRVGERVDREPSR